MVRSIVALALRGMVRRPYYAAVSLIAVAVTLATLLVAAAVLEHTLSRSPPMSRADRLVLVQVQRLTNATQTSTSGLGWRILEPALTELDSAEELAVVRSTRRTDVWGNDVRRVSLLKSANAGFWRVFDFEFLSGGPWGRAEDEDGRRVAVVTVNLARALFGDPAAVGETIDIDGRSHEVVGVVRDVSITHELAFGEIWVPLGSARTDAWRDEARDELMAAVLTRKGVERSEVKAEIARRVASVTPPPPFERVELWADTPLEALSRELFGPEESHVERLIGLLALAALAFMALPALNLVTLAMSRSLERACEIGVRRAYGASRWHLGGQLIAETFVTTLLGAVVALLLAALALELLEASGSLPGADLALGPLTLIGSGLLAAVFALLSGALPAWRMARLHPIEALSGRSDR